MGNEDGINSNCYRMKSWWNPSEVILGCKFECEYNESGMCKYPVSNPEDEIKIEYIGARV
jgi:hypothetical protein